ncbi:MAG: hypothetical protein ACOC5G_02350, partial [Acidobacteriota bacterium]
MRSISIYVVDADFMRGRARDEEAPVRAERAWFLFRGERSPNRKRDSSRGNRAGDESHALPLIMDLEILAFLC